MEDDRFVRSFIAIELSPTIIDNIRKVQDELKKGTSQVAWVKPENIHLTIRFLGDIKTDIINDINKIIELAASQLSNFKLSIKRIGAFPKIDNPRVIWVGVEDDSDLSRLYNEIENGLVALGFKKEEIINIFPQLLKLKNLKIIGLMTIAPYSDEPEKSRPVFHELKQIKYFLENKFNVKLPELSMGMSNDYKIAIAEGSTIIRLGRIIFE